MTATAADDRPTELQKLRAALIMHFAKDTKWPEPPEELRVIVVGRDDIGTILEGTLRQKLQKRVLVERTENPTEDDFAGAHMAVFSDSSRHDQRRLAALCRKHDVLSIGEELDFLGAGGMVTVGVDSTTHRPLLRINIDALKDSRLSVRPALASLCQILHKGTG